MSRTTLAIDVGTHAARALIFGPEGELLSSASRPLTLQHPAPGHVEQDPEAMREALREAIDEVLASAATTPAGAGLAVQRSSVLLWRRDDGEPLTPILSWQDTRAADLLDPLANEEDEIARRTGLRLSPHYGASKLSRALSECEHAEPACGPLAAWLALHILESGPARVDHANASRTLLWNLETRDWDPLLCERFGVPVDALPRCRPIRHGYGVLRNRAIPLTAMSGDQNAAALADGPLPPGHALVNLGTGAFVLAPTGDAPRRVDRLLTGPLDSDADGASYLIEGTVNGAGAAFAWAEERWKLAPIAPRLDAMPAPASPPILLNAVGGLGSPWWRHDVDTRIVGPEGEEEIAFGVMESVLFLLRANLDRLAAGGAAPRVLRVTGGLARSRRVCAGLAALSGLPVERPEQAEATARGIAWLAAGRPSTWPGSRSERFEPVSDPALEARHETWLAMMEDLA